MKMGLIVEDGSGVPNADSYNSIAELDAYMQKFGYEAWPISEPVREPSEEPEEPQEPAEDSGGQPDSQNELPDAEENDPILAKKEAAARRAAIYLDSKYAIRFTGAPANAEQGLAWPRTGAVDYYGRAIADNIVPDAMKQAHAEVSLLAYTNTQLYQQTAAGPLLKRKKIDVLEWEYDVDTYSDPPIFGWVDQLLTPLLGPPEQVGALDILGIQRA